MYKSKYNPNIIQKSALEIGETKDSIKMLSSLWPRQKICNQNINKFINVSILRIFDIYILTMQMETLPPASNPDVGWERGGGEVT